MCMWTWMNVYLTLHGFECLKMGGEGCYWGHKFRNSCVFKWEIIKTKMCWLYHFIRSSLAFRINIEMNIANNNLSVIIMNCKHTYVCICSFIWTAMFFQCSWVHVCEWRLGVKQTYWLLNGWNKDQHMGMSSWLLVGTEHWDALVWD